MGVSCSETGNSKLRMVYLPVIGDGMMKFGSSITTNNAWQYELKWGEEMCNIYQSDDSIEMKKGQNGQYPVNDNIK
jgi:hypothetical protein